ncbi:MAG: hypothetical protein JST87_06235 [Bacteroidetes bacterium]|nr:hypothetical protein [Bacteroidota bacterium]
MKKQRNLYLFVGSVMNALLFLVIPDYYFWFLIILAVCVAALVAIVFVDISGKTKMWKKAIFWVGFGLLSWILGMVTIIIRNYFLGYYKN